MLGCYYYYYVCLWRVEHFIFLSDLTTNLDQMIDLRLCTKFLQLPINLEAAFSRI